MLTLAWDTAAEFGSIALVDSSGVREEVLLHAPEGFSGILFGQIDRLLKRHHVSLREIELYAAASGPGSFTGVRIGLAAVKGLAEISGKPASAISNLRALASCAENDTSLRAPLIDARRGEVYAALFDSRGTPVIPESVLPFPRFLELAAGHDFEWISHDFEPFQPALNGTSFASHPVTIAPRTLAARIAALAMAGPPRDPASIEANYVRRSDAELLYKG